MTEAMAAKMLAYGATPGEAQAFAERHAESVRLLRTALTLYRMRVPKVPNTATRKSKADQDA
jgi:hypothetical protein